MREASWALVLARSYSANRREAQYRSIFPRYSSGGQASHPQSGNNHSPEILFWQQVFLKWALQKIRCSLTTNVYPPYFFKIFFFFFFDVGHFLKSLLTLLPCCLHFLMLWFFGHKTCGDLNSPSRGWTCTPCIGRQSQSLGHQASPIPAFF